MLQKFRRGDDLRYAQRIGFHMTSYDCAVYLTRLRSAASHLPAQSFLICVRKLVFAHPNFAFVQLNCELLVILIYIFS